MDIGTAFGTLGARREMLIGFLAEPALLMVLFTASLISQSTSLATIVETLAHRELAIYPSLAFAGVAFTMVSLAENARIPVDNPATHLELTMIHEALILEYSGRHLALIEWAASLKLFAYSCIGLALFFPWGIAEARRAARAAAGRCRSLVVKLAVGGALLALIETAERQDAHLPRARVPRHRVPAGRAGHARAPPAGRHEACTHLATQIINLLRRDAAAARLRDALAAAHPVADQPVRAAGRWRWSLPTAVVAYVTHQPHLTISAGLTLAAQGAPDPLDPAPADPAPERASGTSRR